MRLLRLFPLLALALFSTAAFVPQSVLASSHSEAPGTSKDRLADDTDVYAWVAPDAPNAVTFVVNWVPLLEPNSGPNFYGFDDDAYYYINVDNDGDAQEEIWYQFKFTTTRQTGATFLYNTGPITSLSDGTFNVRQTYTVTRYDNGVPTVLGSNIPVPPTDIGPKSTPNYNTLAQSAVTTLSDGSKVFCGPRDDPFYVDLGSIFDLLTIRKVPGDKGKGIDGLGGFNCMTVALQVPFTRLTKDGMAPNADNSVIGVWSTTKRPQNRTLNADGTMSTSGPLVQISRLGNPLVNEVVIPLQDKDKFNASIPSNDGQFLSYVTNPELAGLLHALFGINVPPAPRNDLVTVFLTGIPGVNQPANVVASEQLRLNMAIPPAAQPNRFGVIAGDAAGFPNGRRLADDVVDIALRVVAGGYVLTPDFNVSPNNKLGDGIDANDRPFLPSFPYVAPPHQGFVHSHHAEQKGNSANSILDRLGIDLDESAAAAGANQAAANAPRLSFAGAHPGSASDLSFTLDRPAHVSLKIYDLQGREVRTLVDQPAAAGTFRARWDGRSADGSTAGKGVYFARYETDGRVADTKKLVLE